MAHSTGHNLSAFFAPRFGRPFIKRLVARQRRRLADEEANAEATVARLNDFSDTPTDFKWYEEDP